MILVAIGVMFVGCGIAAATFLLLLDLLRKLGRRPRVLVPPQGGGGAIPWQSGAVPDITAEEYINTHAMPLLSGPYAYGAYREIGYMGDRNRGPLADALLRRPGNPDLDILVGKRNSHRPLPPWSMSANILWEDAQRALVALGEESITITGLGTVTIDSPRPYTPYPAPEVLLDEGMVPEGPERDGEKLREEL